MAITLESLKKILDEKGLKYKMPDEVDSSRPILYTGWDAEDAEVGKFDVYVVIYLEESTNSGFEFMQIRAVKLADGLEKKFHQLEPAKYKALLEYMAYENYTNKIGTWCYDPSDGDLYLGASLPIEDGNITSKQLLRYLSVMVSVAKVGYRDLRRIYKHGDAKTALMGISTDLIVSLTLKLASAGRADLAGKLSQFKGDSEVLGKAIDAKNWHEVEALLSGAPTSF